MIHDTLADKIQLWGAILFIAMSPVLWIVVAYFGLYKDQFDHTAVIVVAVAYFAVFPVATILSALVRAITEGLDSLAGNRPVLPRPPVIRPVA